MYLAISGTVCILSGLIPSPKYKYTNSVKEKVLQKLVKSLHPENIYSINISLKTLVSSSKIFKNTFINQSKYIVGFNHISGKIEDVPISFSEVKFYKDVINYGKTIGGCLLSILLLPLFIIRGIFTETEEDNDLPGLGIIKDEIKFYEGLFMHANFKIKNKDKLLLIPTIYSEDKTKFSAIDYGNEVDTLNFEQLGMPQQYKLFSKFKTSHPLVEAIAIALKNIYLANGYTPIIAFSEGQLYITLPQKSNYLNFDINKKVNGSEFFEPYFKDYEAFKYMVKSIRTAINKLS
ncbi:hypothetical protein BWZ20_09000 [Winogradskyella sp. J14-2]|nr:hypothetical protein BWZ20_09000 [Winogradskyella sp. J14-2]